jgi:hypothetical protein
LADLPEDDEPKKTSKATMIRRGLVAALALACAGGWIYTRYLVKKETLGGECTYDIHCRSEAPRCMKQDIDGKGVCTRPCDNDSDCAADIKCIKVTLDDYDERGRPLEGGYCIPQAILDARRKKKNDGGAAPEASGDAGPVPTGYWIDPPSNPDQLEGEFTFDRGAQHTPISIEVKGTMFRIIGVKKTLRTIIDTTTMREYQVDDDKRQFSGQSLGVSINTVKVTKTDKKDKVLDKDCDIWQIEEGLSVRQACVIKGGSWVDPGRRGVEAWEKELSTRGVFPLKLVDGDKTKLNATAIAIHPIDASAFQIPKAYKNVIGGRF